MEQGTDLTLTTATLITHEETSMLRGSAYDKLTSLVTVFPQQGYLQPYETCPVYFRFFWLVNNFLYTPK